MSPFNQKNYRKLKLILNRGKSYDTRIVDAETGETVLFVQAIDLHIGSDNRFYPIVQITLSNVEIEIEGEKESE